MAPANNATIVDNHAPNGHLSLIQSRLGLTEGGAHVGFKVIWFSREYIVHLNESFRRGSIKGAQHLPIVVKIDAYAEIGY
jgi:hypothetical protein